MKELLLLLKDLCETETAITLKSLLNGLEMYVDIKNI